MRLGGLNIFDPQVWTYIMCALNIHQKLRYHMTYDVISDMDLYYLFIKDP